MITSEEEQIVKRQLEERLPFGPQSHLNVDINVILHRMWDLGLVDSRITKSQLLATFYFGVK